MGNKSYSAYNNWTPVMLQQVFLFNTKERWILTPSYSKHATVLTDVLKSFPDGMNIVISQWVIANV